MLDMRQGKQRRRHDGDGRAVLGPDAREDQEC